MTKRVLSFFVAPALILLVIGCGSAPTTEMQASETAIETALSAEADQYVPDAYQMALDTLNAAKAAMQEQDSKFALFRGYGDSKEMFIAAQRLAEKAAGDAQVEKENVKAEVSGLLTDADKAIAAALSAYASAPKGKGTKADLEIIKADLNSIQTAYNEATAQYEGGQYMAAKTSLDVIMTRTDKIMQDIEAAKTRKK